MKLEKKNRLLDNIEYLLKKRGIKKSDLETKAGYSVGYLSRFRNDDPNSLPSIGFLDAAATELSVDLPTLLDCDLKKESSSNSYLRELLEKLIKDTKSKKIHWTTQHSDDKLKSLRRSKSNPYFYEKTVRIPQREDLGFNEDGYHEYGDEWDEEIDKLGFRPLTDPETERWTIDCTDSFVEGFFSIAKLAANAYLVLLDACEYEDYQSLDEEPFSHKQLWLLGDENDLLFDEYENGTFYFDQIKKLDSAISSASIEISESNKSVLDNYLKGATDEDSHK